jgi:ribonuclease-3
MSCSNVSVPELPYNNKNKLINKEDIVKFLAIYDDIGNINIYRRAFVHKSYCTRKNENFMNGNVNCPEDCLPLQEENNERLEFLGDAILNLVVGKYLFERYPNVNEGFLTTTRTKLVNGEMCANLSNQLKLNEFVLLSNQIEANNGRKNKNILEDTFEAFIGAIFLDFEEKEQAGFKHAHDWIVNVLEEYVDFTELMTQHTNFKDKLVKHCQHNFQFIPKFYEIDVSENNGGKIHTIYVKNNLDCVIGIGKGQNKKYAEVDASKKALKYYNVV